MDNGYDDITERMCFKRLLELDNQAFRKIESRDFDELEEINIEIDEILLSLVKRRQLINQ